VVLDTDQKLWIALCPATLPYAVTPSDGVRVDLVEARSPSGTFLAGGSCLNRVSVSTCPSSTPDYSILLLRVTVPGRSTPVIVSIGLAGSGKVARTILYSLRAA
jgi:hypothetical protein